MNDCNIACDDHWGWGGVDLFLTLITSLYLSSVHTKISLPLHHKNVTLGRLTVKKIEFLLGFLQGYLELERSSIRFTEACNCVLSQ